MTEKKDIVLRLREKDGSSYAAGLMQEAADEIERLRVCLNPQEWTSEHHHAWHGKLLDINVAFESLREVDSKSSLVFEWGIYYRKALENNWAVPQVLNGVNDVGWLNYWKAMEHYLTHGGGRPVVPHRSGGGYPV